MMLELMRVDDPTGDADEFAHLSVMLTGPKGHRKLILLASGVGDSWTFHSLDIAIDGREDRIPLLRAVP